MVWAAWLGLGFRPGSCGFGLGCGVTAGEVGCGCLG